MTIIKVKDSRYEEYESLLLRRDSLKRDAEQYAISYTQVFGDLIIKVFKKKIECIAKKKKIAYCQKLQNKSLPINEDELERYLEQVMWMYEEELNDLIKENKAVKEAKLTGPLELRKIKEIYYKLAKLIHPDMRPDLSNDKNIQEFWRRIVIAYNFNQLDELEELNFQVNNYLNNINNEDITIEIPNIEEKINKVKEDITKILSTNPYQYKFILEDDEEIEAYKKELEDEYKNYDEYSKELDEVLINFEIVRNYA